MVSIWKTFCSMCDGHYRESGRSLEARCREVPLYVVICPVAIHIIYRKKFKWSLENF